MVLQKRLMICASALGLMASAAAPASAAPWTRGFVVGAYEYAFRYGGRADFARKGEIEPGIDCLHGATRHFADPDQTKKAVTAQKWRLPQEAEWVARPPGIEDVRSPLGTRFGIWVRALAYRGYKRGIETYVNPFAAEDPGQPQVSSRIGDGLNLDGKIKPADFVSPDGERGIDNNLYRAWGCDAPWRGNGNATLDLRANDKMQDGLYTMVIRISGKADPMNDDNATLEIGFSPDKIVKDARNSVAIDYSYRILQSAQYTKLKATIRNGVIETEQVEHLHAPRIAWFYDQTGDANFTKGKLRLNIAPDGLSATGLIGGYRNWRDLYAENTFAQDGGQQGVREHEDHVALYYALRRNADGMLNPATGKYDGISSIYRIRMSGAYVVDPDKPMDIPILAGDLYRKKVFEAIKANTIRGAETRIPQPVPPGTGEASYPGMERGVRELASRDFFLKTLDRPHYPDGVGRDQRNFLIDDQGNRMDAQGKIDERDDIPPPPAKRPMPQVSNAAPTKVASTQAP
ncbi:MAG: hypothetical protein NTX21_13035 [Alphaproteobacteria bacterium]|nr:hypothetical protein [Alphaproteobacteria bacterium]